MWLCNADDPTYTIGDSRRQIIFKDPEIAHLLSYAPKHAVWHALKSDLKDLGSLRDFTCRLSVDLMIRLDSNLMLPRCEGDIEAMQRSGSYSRSHSVGTRVFKARQTAAARPRQTSPDPEGFPGLWRLMEV
ncbi:hypothetical protein C8R44DRAFT_735063 [Mycena epipterygia]|nr:hypothetical protein C8R44DRAFT_735063 [Mycena epipterygia]